MLPIAFTLAIAAANHGATNAVEPSAAVESSNRPVEWSSIGALQIRSEETRREPTTFSYSFVEVGAMRYDVDNLDDEADVYYGRGSIGILDFLYLFGGYSNQSIDFQDTDTDVIELGGGVHFPVLPRLDLFGEVAWLYNDVNSDLSDLDDTTYGYRVLGGARWMALPWDRGGLELNGGIGFIDLDNRLGSDEQVSVGEIGARVHFLESFSVGSTYSRLEDDDQISLNVRLSF